MGIDDIKGPENDSKLIEDLQAAARQYLDTIKRYRALPDDRKEQVHGYFELEAKNGSHQAGIILDGLLNIEEE